jgi:hypothetical protein
MTAGTLDSGRVSGQPDPPVLHLLAEVRRQNELLRQLLVATSGGEDEIALSNGTRQTRRMQDWPIQGFTRYLRPCTGYGALVTVPATTVTAVSSCNEARMGGTVVNSGGGSVILWLCQFGEVNVAARPQISLFASGGSWDYRLSNRMWCGEVWAYSTAGTTLTVAEV